MKELIFATHNAHKLKEVEAILPEYSIKSLDDIGFYDEIVEDGDSFAANAELKVDAIAKTTDQLIFADDSGLVIPALDNAPGIYSSRYAGTGKSEDNIAKVLENLLNEQDRYAYFITVICLLWNGEKHFFEGTVDGEILLQPYGKGGFGYDPIFKPAGYDITFAELSSADKNAISHRNNALIKMRTFLNKQNDV